MSDDNFGYADPDTQLRRKLRIREALSRAKPVLYDAFGNVVPFESDQITATDEEWRERVREILSEVIEPMLAKTPQEFTDHLRSLKNDPRYEFDIVDGKLTLPFRAKVGATRL